MVKERDGGTSKADRISLHSRELFRSFHDWLDLRVQLAFINVFARLQHNQKTIYFAVAACITFIVSAIFLLIAAALGLGVLIGNMILGFASISLVMGIVSWILYSFVMRAIHRNGDQPENMNGKTNGRTRSETKSVEQ